MSVNRVPVLGLIVRAVPYQQRSARSQLDVALVAAALEMPVRLYFLGHAALQLISQRELKKTRLPQGYRAWASLPEMTEVYAFAEPGWIGHMKKFEINPLLQLHAMSRKQMRTDWQVCDKVLVL